MELPKTKEELLKLMKLAFESGQKCTEGDLKYERYGDMDAYAKSKPTKNFETWANQDWKYGKSKT